MKAESRDTIWYRLLVKASPFFTALLLVLAGVGAYLGTGVQLKLSLTDLLPPDHPAVVKFEKLTEVVGGVGYFAIVLHGEDEDSLVAAATPMVAEFKQSDLVRDAFFAREQRFFVDRMLYYLSVPELKDLETNITRQIRTAREQVFDLGLWDEDEKRTKDAKPVFNDDLRKAAKDSAQIRPNLISKDGKHLLVMVKPSFDSTDLKRSEDLIAFAEQVVGRHLPAGVTHDFAERYYRKVVETKIIRNDILFLGGLAILLILLVLYAYLRSARALVVIFLPIFLAMGITMGFTRVFIGHVNIITGFLMGILSGLGVDYSIHLFLRLRLERREPTTSDPDPVWRALSSTGHAIVVGALSGAFAFYLLGFSSFKAFSEFGIICGTGILAVVLCLLFTFSALVRLFRLDSAPLQPLSAGWFSKLPSLSLPRGLVTGCAVTAGLVVLGTFVRFEYDFDRMMRHSAVVEQLQYLVDDIYERSNTPSALAAPDYETAVAVENLLKEKYVPGLVSEVISGATIIPKNQEEKARILGRIRQDLSKIKDRWIEKSLNVPADAVRTWLDARPFTFQDLPSHLQDALRGRQGTGFLLYLYPAIKLSNAQGVRTYAAMIREVESRFPSLLSGSDAVVFADILDLIFHDGLIMLALILATVAALLWLNIRRPDDTLASYLPLIVAFVVAMGLMVVFGIRFNIINICIIPSFVAISIDVPIHLVHRARETRSGYKAARDLAPSMNLALLTTALGFGVLVAARAGVLRSLGWIAILGNLAIWWVGTQLLPAFLEWYCRRKEPSVTHYVPAEPQNGPKAELSPPPPPA